MRNICLHQFDFVLCAAHNWYSVDHSPEYWIEMLEIMLKATARWYMWMWIYSIAEYIINRNIFLAFKPQGPINEWILNLHTVGGTGRSVPDSNSQNIHASRIFVFILLRINSNDLNNSKQHLRSPRNRTNDGGLCYANTGGISLTADMAINNDHAESTQLSYR